MADFRLHCKYHLYSHYGFHIYSNNYQRTTFIVCIITATGVDQSINIFLCCFFYLRGVYWENRYKNYDFCIECIILHYEYQNQTTEVSDFNCVVECGWVHTTNYGLSPLKSMRRFKPYVSYTI